MKNFTEQSITAGQVLVTAGAINAKPLLGASSPSGKTGVFTRTPALSGWLISGSGSAMSHGIVLGSCIVMSENTVTGEP